MSAAAVPLVPSTSGVKGVETEAGFTTAATELETPAADKNAASLVKLDRKRLKKLRKRACNVITDGEFSGLLTRVEWLEFQKLLELNNNSDGNSDSFPTAAPKVFGPLISRRKKKEANKVEGCHHRDLIAWCMDRIKYRCLDIPSSIQQSKKRPRNSENASQNNPLEHPSIPSWASIHNPATIESLVVVQVQLASTDAVSEQGSQEAPPPPQPLFELFRSAIDQAVAQCQGRRSTLHLPTKWFQGHIPKSMSESLFYFVDNNTASRSYKRAKGENFPSHEQLIQDLQDLILPLDDWSKEGYPIRMIEEAFSNNDSVPTDKVPSIPTMQSIQDLGTLSLDDCLSFVKSCGFRVQHQDKDDPQLYIGMEPSVGTKTTASTGDAKIDKVRVFGMDCEMVRTSLGSELARITLVQLNSFTDDKLDTTTVLDALVKPVSPVLDYLTRHSGITAQMLDPVSTRLEQVQVALQNLLRPCDILVGHSLENDLMAAHYLHPRVIDTALIFRHGNKRSKFSLRHISASLLGKTIQRGSHCSQEDAETTLELAVRRAWLGGEVFALPNMDERRSIWEKWNSAKELKSVCVGPAPWMQAHVTNQSNGVHALGCDSISECQKALLAWTKEGPRKAHLAWCNVELTASSSWTATSKSANDFESWMTSLLQQVSPTTVVAVALQQSLVKAKSHYKAKRAGQDPRSSLGWEAKKEEEFQKVLESSRHGIVSWVGSK